jgi:hypothetical protein
MGTNAVKCERPFCPQTLWLIGAGWFLLALFVGETNLLAELPTAAPQLIILALTVFVLGSYFGVRSFRTAIDASPLRALLAIHLTRFVGIYFLVLSARGALDSGFAIPAGYGDIAIAVGALLLLAVPSPRWVLLLWNSLGLIDTLFVVGKATCLRLHDASALSAFTSLPLSFLPTMVVPLIIASHIVLFVRCLGGPAPVRPSQSVVGAGTV